MNHARQSLRPAIPLLGLLLVACDVTGPLVDLDELEWVAVSAGREHTCALTAEARLACWGSNDRGQLGTGDSAERGDAAFVPTDVRFRRVSSGGRHTCAIDEQRALWCWGANDLGQLGDGTWRDRRTPVLASVQGPITDVSAGDEHTCAVRAYGEGLCWGANQVGQVGSGAASQGGLPPSPIRGALNFTAVSAGGTHSCGVANGGSGFCWGGNQTGSLGAGTLIDSSSPVILTGERLFRILRAGDTHSCGVDDQAHGWCWGNNQFGQIASTPERIDGSPVSRSDASFRDIGVGEHWTCALLVRAGVRCWGVRWDETAGDGTRPVSRDGWAPEIASTSTPVALSVGARHACIVSEAMRIFCWGR
jgi:alpha-tubulin suppressor-like RCC1 family protein